MCSDDACILAVCVEEALSRAMERRSLFTTLRRSVVTVAWRQINRQSREHRTGHTVSRYQADRGHTGSTACANTVDSTGFYHVHKLCLTDADPELVNRHRGTVEHPRGVYGQLPLKQRPNYANLVGVLYM